MVTGRLPLSAHTSQPWRIHEVARDFRVLDVWALPTPGGPDDFPLLVGLFETLDFTQGSAVVRALFAIRFKVGGLLGLDRVPGESRAAGFTPLYQTDDERARARAELEAARRVSRRAETARRIAGGGGVSA